jgi:N-acetylmuramoyl-L-alanine amidase
VADYRHRLLFDLYPVQEADPLLALIRDKEAAEQQAVQAVQQTLDELIARVERRLPAPAAGDGAAPLQTPAPQPPPTEEPSAGVSTGWSSSRSTPATAARTPAPSAPAGCARRTWCWPSRGSCATAQRRARHARDDDARR